MEIASLIRPRVYNAIKFSADFQALSHLLCTTPAYSRHIQDEAISEWTLESHSRGTIVPVLRLDLYAAHTWQPEAFLLPLVFRNEEICMNQKFL